MLSGEIYLYTKANLLKSRDAKPYGSKLRSRAGYDSRLQTKREANTHHTPNPHRPVLAPG